MMANRSWLMLVAVAVAVLGGVPVRADWARWRGPEDNWHVSASSWDAQSFGSRMRVVWRADVGRGHSSMVVRGDRLYTMGQRVSGSGAQKTTEELVYCLSTATGREIWRYAYRSAHRSWPGPGATPVLDGERLYAMGREGELFCLDAATGNVIWKRHLAEEKLMRVPEWGFCASPVVEANLLLLSGNLSGMALDKLTGKVVWTSALASASAATPVVLGQVGRKQAAIANDKALSLVDVANGKVRWTQEWQTFSDPIVLGNRLLLTGSHREGSTLLDIQGAAPKPVWKERHFRSTFQSAVALDGHAYGFGNASGQPLQCVEIATGKLKWSQNLGQWGSLIAVNSSLLIAEGDGDFVVADASPAGFREVARIRAIAMTPAETGAQNDAMRGVWTAPVFDNGRVYVRDNFGALVCIAPRS
jgi:outer membrane protein assembly factor BamB